MGTLMEGNDGGQVILLKRTFNPAGVPNPDGRDTVMLSMFVPRVAGAQAGDTPPLPDEDEPF